MHGNSKIKHNAWNIDTNHILRLGIWFKLFINGTMQIGLSWLFDLLGIRKFLQIGEKAAKHFGRLDVAPQGPNNFPMF